MRDGETVQNRCTLESLGFGGGIGPMGTPRDGRVAEYEGFEPPELALC